MQPLLLDSSIYITALRKADQYTLSLRGLDSSRPVWLSAVVLQELYAGATGTAVAAVERLEYDFGKAGRLFAPSNGDWARAGRLLARLAARYDYEQVGKARLTNDALIATSAGRLGILVITKNVRDFARLEEFQHFRWQVKNF